jgi:hypothetical protein
MLDLLAKRLDALPTAVSERRRIPLGTYRGLCFGITMYPNSTFDLYLEGAASRATTLSRDHPGPRAILNGLERLVAGYPSHCKSAHEDLAIAEGQLRDYELRLGAPFLNEGYLSELTALRDRLKVALSGATCELASDRPVTAAELAEQIKALRAVHTVDTFTPERQRPRRAAFEEPVTERIRRHAERRDRVALELVREEKLESPAPYGLDVAVRPMPAFDGGAEQSSPFTSEQPHQRRLIARQGESSEVPTRKW